MAVKIGIVDDDQRTVHALSEYAVTLGYEVTSARDGEEGLQLFLRERPDLLILDGLLPKLHGFDLCKKIKQTPDGKTTPVVIVTGVYKGTKYRMQVTGEYRADGYFEKPVDLQKLFATVAELTKHGTEVVESLSDEDLHFTRLTECLFPSLLHKLYDEKRTGTLILEKDHVRKSVYFKQGYIAFASSNQKKERLSELLIAEKIITPEQMSTASQKIKQSGRRFGLQLLESGWIDPATLERVLQRQLENILFDVFSWVSGYFAFVPSLLEEECITLRTAPAQVILRGIQNTYSAEMLERQFPETATVFVLSSDPVYRFQNVELTDREKRMMLLLDGSNTVAQISGLSESDPLDVRKFLLALSLSRIIQKKDDHRSDDTQILLDHESRPDTERDLRKSVLQKYIQVQTQGPWEILGIDKTRDQKVIKQAFLQQAKRYHPDHFFHRLDDKYNDYIKSIFQKINQAYQRVLQDVPEAGMAKESGGAVSPLGQKPAAESDEERLAQAEHFYDQGMNMVKQGDYEGARTALLSAVQCNPKDPEYHLQLGLLFLEHPDHSDSGLELAESAFRHAMNLSSKDARPFFYLGYVYKVKNDLEQSEQMFRKALERNPNYIEALREIRLISSRKKKSVKQIFKEMIGIH